MPVADERLRPPLLKASRELYEPTDLITVGCEPQALSTHVPLPTITWYIDGVKVSVE
jgi:hypothetical protein